MWRSEHFVSLDLALAFVNDRQLGPDRFKIVVSHDDDEAQVFSVLYLAEEAALEAAAVATAEADPLTDAPADEVLETAEAIIADAQRDEAVGARR